MSALPRLLLVDSSKVVRASLAKSLKDHFDIREEISGELAWETLILDSSIVAVICGISLPKMTGLDLLEKIRLNKLGRLKHLPFFLTASESMIDEIRDQALGMGASGFVPKAFGADEVNRVLAKLFVETENGTASDIGGVAEVNKKLTESDVFGAVGAMSEMGASHSSASGRDLVYEPRGFLETVPRIEIVADLAARIAAADSHQRGVGVLLLVMDNYPMLVEHFGHEMANRIEDRFGQLLAAKLRAADKIQKVAADRIAILVSGTNLQKCTEFAERVCAKLGAAEIMIKGQRIEMSVSIGAACFPDDAVDSGNELFSLAEERLEMACRAGGNRVMAISERQSGNLRRKQAAAWINELADQRAQEVPPALLGHVGLLLLPVWKQIDAAYALGLDLAHIEQTLQAHANDE